MGHFNQNEIKKRDFFLLKREFITFPSVSVMRATCNVSSFLTERCKKY